MQNPEHGAHPELLHRFPDVLLEIGRNPNRPKWALSVALWEQMAPRSADVAMEQKHGTVWVRRGL